MDLDFERVFDLELRLRVLLFIKCAYSGCAARFPQAIPFFVASCKSFTLPVSNLFFLVPDDGILYLLYALILLEMAITSKFWPPKYYKGLTMKQKIQRYKEIQHSKKFSWKDPRAYKGFKTDTLGKTKKSQYTRRWNTMFPKAKSLKQRAQATGIPESLLRESYNRGLAAYRTGHRLAATQQQWGYARASSMALCGKTALTTDSDLVRKAKKRSRKARDWFKMQGC